MSVSKGKLGGSQRSAEGLPAEDLELTPAQPREIGHTFAMNSQYEGPLPPPSVLAEFDRVVPGFAERLITAFELQAAHRREMETAMVSSWVKFTQRGQTIGAVIVLLLIAAALFSGLVGQTATSIAFVVSIAAICAVFVSSGSGREGVQRPRNPIDVVRSSK